LKYLSTNVQLSVERNVAVASASQAGALIYRAVHKNLAHNPYIQNFITYVFIYFQNSFTSLISGILEKH